MVPSIARQSVMIKCNMQTSVLTGNYELYYVAGLISKLEGVEVTPDLKPLELLETLQEKTKDLRKRSIFNKAGARLQTGRSV